MSTLRKLHTNIKNHQKGKLSVEIVLLHDSTKLRMVGLTQSMLRTLKFEVLTHPAYSSDFSPRGYEVFDSLKKFFEGKRFSTDGEVKKCWQKCIDRNGNYVEH